MEDIVVLFFTFLDSVAVKGKYLIPLAFETSVSSTRGDLVDNVVSVAVVSMVADVAYTLSFV